MDLKLNIKDNSIRKKRGKSFFQENRIEHLGDPPQDFVPAKKVVVIDCDEDQERFRRKNGEPPSAARFMQKAQTLSSNLGIGAGLGSSAQKEIVSAMVRMNTEGL